MDKIKELLMLDGVSTEFVMEKLNLKKRTATKLLHEMGAFCDYKTRKWKLHNVERLKNCRKFNP
jgi:hypothetical protein